MNGLKDIRDDIQNIAEAMLSVLNIDVTIVNSLFIFSLFIFYLSFLF